MAKIGNELMRMVAVVLASVGAINWGLIEFAGTDLLVDTLGLTGDTYTAVIAVVAAAGALALYNVGVVELLGDPMDG
ncbi:DUF378 domain-containing protein [Halovenus marina]|uniref:DUF378 domain-containing protein n=1 Tax=Halovenus marina TaxID=3396621 RepID=UPI003F55844A